MSSTSEAQQAGHDTGSNVSGNLEMTGTSPQVEVRTGDETETVHTESDASSTV